MLKKIEQSIEGLSNGWVALIIAVFGILSYADGLFNPFEADDKSQIVDSIPVHSLSHVKLLFEGGTFYANGGLSPLSGAYYRPLMTTLYSLIYSVFGAKPFGFHLVQLLIVIATAYILYLFFRYSFKVSLSLFLALVYLVHPEMSQIAFAIPSMQDVLYVFFGMSAIYLLVKYRSFKSLAMVVPLLFLSLISKESAVLFVIMGGVYLLIWDRSRAAIYSSLMVIPLVTWFIIRWHAVGILQSPSSAPIDNLSLIERLYTAPSIILLYLSKFVFPWKLSTTYYFVYPKFGVMHVLLPVTLDILVIGVFIYLGYLIKQKSSKGMYFTYLFFGLWFILGLALILQIIPLDMTASLEWFYYPIIGLLGMIGVVVSELLPKKINYGWLIVGGLILVCLMATRTIYRGLDFSSQTKLAINDYSNSVDNYHAANVLIGVYLPDQEYSKALPYALNAVKVLPTYNEYINLANIYVNLGEYANAQNAYFQAINYSTPRIVQSAYDGLGDLTLVYPVKYQDDKQSLQNALAIYPKDATLWVDLAVLNEQNGDHVDAVSAINHADFLDQAPPGIFTGIIGNKPFNVTVGEQTISVK